jgi:hypothetical protein
LPLDVDDPRLLPFCIGSGLGVDVLHVELAVPGPHPGPTCFVGGGGGGVPALPPVGGAFVRFPNGATTPVGLTAVLRPAGQSLAGIQYGGIPGSQGIHCDFELVEQPPVGEYTPDFDVVIGFVVFPIAPGGALITLTGGGNVPVLLPVGGAFGPNGAITPVVLTEPPRTVKRGSQWLGGTVSAQIVQYVISKPLLL